MFETYYMLTRMWFDVDGQEEPHGTILTISKNRDELEDLINEHISNDLVMFRKNEIVNYASDRCDTFHIDRFKDESTVVKQDDEFGDTYSHVEYNVHKLLMNDASLQVLKKQVALLGGNDEVQED